MRSGSNYRTTRRAGWCGSSSCSRSTDNDWRSRPGPTSPSAPNTLPTTALITSVRYPARSSWRPMRYRLCVSSQNQRSRSYLSTPSPTRWGNSMRGCYSETHSHSVSLLTTASSACYNFYYTRYIRSYRLRLTPFLQSLLWYKPLGGSSFIHVYSLAHCWCWQKGF